MRLAYIHIIWRMIDVAQVRDSSCGRFERRAALHPVRWWQDQPTDGGGGGGNTERMAVPNPLYIYIGTTFGDKLMCSFPCMQSIDALIEMPGFDRGNIIPVKWLIYLSIYLSCE